MRAATLSLLAGLALVIVGALLFSRAGEERVVPPTAALARSAQAAQAPLANLAPPAVLDARAAAPRSAQPAAAESASSAPHYVLRIELVQPDGSELALDARARLEETHGEVLELQTGAASSELASAITPGRWRLTIAAAGHRHEPEDLELDLERFEPVNEHLVYRHEATLWPGGWIAVCARTREGRPFRALADDLEEEPKRFFWQAFDVRVARESFVAQGLSAGAASDPLLAAFVPAPGYHNVEVASGVFGSLQELAPRPWWAGLWLHGEFVAEELVTPAATAVVFEVDMATLDARLARLSFVLTDAGSVRALSDARATLKADTSAHRRADLANRTGDERGRYVFERVIPGQHELAIEHAGSLLQRRITLAPGEDRDLGELALASEQGLALVVQDPDGKPVTAFIEVAPYQPGAVADELYPPNLCRATDAAGHYLLPVPDSLSIVRARPLVDRGGGYAPVGTRNYLVDPARLPSELCLQARSARSVRIELATALEAGERAWIEDELGLVVEEVGESGDEVELVPGSYRMQRELGGARSSHLFAVDDATDALQVP